MESNQIADKNTQKSNPKKAYILAAFIIILGIVILWLFMRINQNQQMQQKSAYQAPKNPTPTISLADSTLTMQVNSLTPTSQVPSSISILIDSGKNKVVGAQFLLKYDPKVLRNVSVSKGTFIDNPVEPIDPAKAVDPVNGTISYAIAMSPTNSKPSSGRGVIATINFSPIYSPLVKQTTITFANQPIILDFYQRDANDIKTAQNLTLTFPQK